MIIVVNGLRSGEGGGEGKEIAPGRFFFEGNEESAGLRENV